MASKATKAPAKTNGNGLRYVSELSEAELEKIASERASGESWAELEYRYKIRGNGIATKGAVLRLRRIRARGGKLDAVRDLNKVLGQPAGNGMPKPKAAEKKAAK